LVRDLGAIRRPRGDVPALGVAPLFDAHHVLVAGVDRERIERLPATQRFPSLEEPLPHPKTSMDRHTRSCTGTHRIDPWFADAAGAMGFRL
jgi:hypothetical protein